MAASIIGADLTFIGNIVSKGEVQIEGEIQGDIFCSTLLIAETGRVRGAVVAEEVVVRGRVLGTIHALNITLASNSHLEGDVCHQNLVLEQGSFFEGRSRRADDPLSLAATDDSPTNDPVSKIAKSKLNAASLQRVA
ncbi:MAG: polymer-forming cytoskeletal protein [Pseudomonadota bacterium]|nr:polymer-forming cytoskeletal protein [Pseudomonadota bacterium]